MVKVVTSATFDRWPHKLKDRRAVARVLIRIDLLTAGNPGDVKPVGRGDITGQSIGFYACEDGASTRVTNADGSVSTSVTASKQAVQVAQLPSTPLPALPPTP